MKGKFKMCKYEDCLLQFKFKEADEIRRSLIPPKLYKYVPLENDENDVRLKTLERQEIWLSKVASLNDPYEFKVIYNDFGSQNEFQHLMDACVEWSCFASLTANGAEHLPMWAYYANNHKGMCIEYDVLSSEYFFPVGYNEKRVPLSKILSAIPTNEEDELFEEKAELARHLFGRLLYQKHISWKSENEYRLIHPRAICEDTSKRGMSLPLTDVGLKTSRIIAGYNCVLTDRIKMIAKKISVPFVQCGISESQYMLLEEGKSDG